MQESKSSKSGKRRAVMIALGLAISALCLFLLFRDLSIEHVLQEIARVDLVVLSLVIPLDFVAFLFIAWRTHVLFNEMSTCSYREALKSVLLGYAGNNTLPLRAGELLRVGYLARVSKTPSSACLTLVGFERILDMVIILVLFTVSVSMTALSSSATAVLWTVAPALGAVLLFLWLIRRFPERFSALARRAGGLFGSRGAEFVGGLASNVVDGLAALNSPVTMLGVLALTLANWLITAVSMSMWFFAFDLSLPWYAPLLLIGFVSFGNLLPSSPANVGTFHYFAAKALVVLGVGKATATSVAVVGHVAGTLPFTLVGIIWGFAVFAREIGRAHV